MMAVGIWRRQDFEMGGERDFFVKNVDAPPQAVDNSPSRDCGEPRTE